MCNIKLKYLRQISTTRAEIFTSDRGILKDFFSYEKHQRILFLVSKANINSDLRAQKNVIDRSIRIFKALSLGKDMRKPK